MSRSEIKKLRVINKLITGACTTVETGQALGLCTRQILRLKARVLQHGAESLGHGNRGRPPMHAICPQDRKRIVDLYQDRYTSANYCHLSQLLSEHEGIQASPPSLDRILKAAGITSARQRRRPAVHWRKDASTHLERHPST